MDPAFVFFDDPSPWPFRFSEPIVNFAVQSGPSVLLSTPVPNATCPAADLSNSTERLGSDSVALKPNSSVQIPDEDSLVDDESFWAELTCPEESHHLFPELPAHEPVDSTGVAPPDVSISSTSGCRWQNFVWLIRACHRFSRAAAASLRAKVPDANLTDYVIKGVMKKRGKFVCETRIMKKMQVEKKNIKKVWLGTYQTPAQAARALDVGKYFFNAKETKTFFDPNTETMLSTLSAQLLAKPLSELVAKVKQIANHYGKHGTLP